MNPWGAAIADWATTQIGKPYVFGAEVNVADDNPAAFDCSELMQWAIWHAGKVLAPDGSWIQQNWCYRNGGASAMDMIRDTAGLLVFRCLHRDGTPVPPDYMGPRPFLAHVGVTDGYGNVIEALNPRTGVRRAPLSYTSWTAAFTVPQFGYTRTSTPVDSDESEDDEMQYVYVQWDNGIWRRHGNTVALLTQPVWDYESKLAEFLGKPITVVTDPDLARLVLERCLDTRTGREVEL